MATKQISGIEAALNEAAGKGALTVEGRAIVYRDGAYSTRWSHRTPKEAETILRVLRKAPQHVRAA